MIAPEPGAGINKQTEQSRLIRNNLLLAALIFTALEFWRPYFFLTDDNLDGFYPYFVERGQDLLQGHWPFTSQHLFGGNYNLLRDPSCFTWHPLYLMLSLLAGTPFHCAIIDVDALFLMMLAASGFVLLADYLRRDMALTISDGWITFYTQSYTFSMIALTTGASWINFLGDYSALPWLALGILQKRRFRGIGLVALFCLHQLLGGHLSPTVSNTIFLSFFALGLSLAHRSWLPLGNWLLGYAAALLLILPLLIPMLSGFSASLRSQGVSLDDMQAYSIPVLQFPSSLFLGMTLSFFNHHYHPYTTYTLALGQVAASWCLLPALAGQRRWREIEVVTFVMMIFVAVLICRPFWITGIMAHLPIFRSMRWPFREFLQFQFFLHLFLLVRPPGLTPPWRKYIAWFSALFLIIPLVLNPLPPTFNAMNWDRELILNGGLEKYWTQVRPTLKPTDRIAVIIPLDVYESNRFEVPYSLLPTYDYAVLAGVINAGGYSPTAPLDQVYTKSIAFYPFGAYEPDQKTALLTERPDLKFITLESLQPLKITLSSGEGPTVDLTPFVPARKSKVPPGPVPP